MESLKSRISSFARLLVCYKLLSNNERLSFRRHPMFDMNRTIRFLALIILGFWAVYLICLSVAAAFAFENNIYEAFDYIDGYLSLFLLADFVTRFILQQTPASVIKPYKLLDVRQSLILNIYLVNIGAAKHNLFWGFFFVPFSLLAIVRFFGFGGMIGYLIGIWLVYVLNGYFYLLWRNLMKQNVLYLVVPLGLYAASACHFSQFTSRLCRSFIDFNILAYLAVLALIALLFYINKKLIAKLVYDEIAGDGRCRSLRLLGNKETRRARSHSLARCLSAFGLMLDSLITDHGSRITINFLLLELRSLRRNRTIRKQFLIALLGMIMLFVIFTFTHLYDKAGFMRSFVIVYMFSCFGSISLSSLMQAEGNYMDLLMYRKRSVLDMLKAKYIYNILVMMIPLCLALLSALMGKFLMIEIFSTFFFCAGCIFPFLFQMAVYNKSCISLDAQISRSTKNTKLQMIFSLVSMFVPMLVMYILSMLFSLQISSTILMIMGFVGIALSPLWLNNIYKRFMHKRYDNMAGFRASRQ